MSYIVTVTLPANPHCSKAGVQEITADEIRYQMLDADSQPINTGAVNLADRLVGGFPTEQQLIDDIGAALGIE